MVSVTYESYTQVHLHGLNRLGSQLQFIFVFLIHALKEVDLSQQSVNGNLIKPNLA